MAKQYHILTFGCQMNCYDSHLMEYLLENEGYEYTACPDSADLIIVNTCAVREHAVNRALARIDALKVLKEKNSNVRIGITGCIPQQMKATLLTRRPFVDFVLGTDNLHLLVQCAHEKNGMFLDTCSDSPYASMTPARGRFPEAFVAAMRGCNNFCSFCVVPYVRGKERSRELNQITDEVALLSEQGYSRIVLLGQNVNNYANGQNRLPQLLSAVSSIKGIQRIGFLTSHPAYFPLETMSIMKHDTKVERFLHLPLQSGSNSILRRMKRHYTAEDYLRLIDTIRQTVPDIALSTDIIVGFPGETGADFARTMEVVSKIEFDSAYTFRYSARLNTLAGTMGDSIPEQTKKERLRELICLQTSITRKKSKAYAGRLLDVLVLGRNDKNLLETNTISVYNKRVIVKGTLETGTTLRVRVSEVKGWTPIAVPLLK